LLREAPLQPTHGPGGWNAWLAEQERQLAPGLARTRDALLAHARLHPGDQVLDLGAGRGLIALAAAARVGPAGRVIASDRDGDCLAALRAAAGEAGLAQLTTVQADAQAVPFASASFAAVTARSVLQFLPDRPAAIREAARVLQPAGRFACAEPLNRYLTPHHHLLDLTPLGELGKQIDALFTEVYADPSEPMLTFDERDLVGLCEAAGLVEVGFNLLVHWERLQLTPDQARARLTTSGAADRPSITALIAARLGQEAAHHYAEYFVARASAQPLAERHGFVFVWASKP
jgi:SAM-dependent methyltransferase